MTGILSAVSAAGSFAWATSKNDDGDVINGHTSDWIYPDGWKNPGKTLKVL